VEVIQMPTLARTSGLGRLLLVCGLAAALLGPALPVRAQQATPGPSHPGSLAALLQLVPDVPAGMSGDPFPLAAYGDLAAQAAVAGLPLPTSVDDPSLIPWRFALSPVIAPYPLVAYPQEVDWRSLLGVAPWEIDQALQTGEELMVLTVLRGRFDPALVRAAWARQAYTMLTVDGVAVASLHEEANPGIDLGPLDRSLGRDVSARFNNAALLPDGTLAYAPTLDGMRALIAAALGTAPSLGDRNDVAALAGAAGEPLASALLLAGADLQGERMLGPALNATPAIPAVQTIAAGFEHMPPISLALLGITPGGPLDRPSDDVGTVQADLPPARFEIALLLPTHADAETAARIAGERVESGVSLYDFRPLTEYFASSTANAVLDQPIAVLELNFAPDVLPALWVAMINRRDLPFLAW
jgi:hypothetical protein